MEEGLFTTRTLSAVGSRRGSVTCRRGSSMASRPTVVARNNLATKYNDEARKKLAVQIILMQN